MKIIDNIYKIDGVFANSYFIKGPDALIDTGIPNSGKRILAYLKSINARPRYIFLTHAHLDHSGSAYYIRKKTHAKVAIHYADAGYLTGEKSFAMPKGLLGLMMKLYMPFAMRRFKPDLMLNGGETIEGIEVIRIYGHTEGSCAFLHKPTRSLFIGDSISTETGRLSLPADRYNLNTEMLKESLKKLKGIMFDNLFPGHGEPVIGGAHEKVMTFLATL